jgi:hypothetical protein
VNHGTTSAICVRFDRFKNRRDLRLVIRVLGVPLIWAISA